MFMYKFYLTLFWGILFLSACVHTERLHHWRKRIEKDSVLRSAHCGIAIWDTEKNKYLIRYQSDQYFVPASNVKIATLYAALKYLPDSLPAFDFYRTPDTVFILPKGEPTLFDPDFDYSRTLAFLKKEKKPVVVLPVNWDTEIYGKGRAWDDYTSSYMPEKSPIPINSNDIGKQKPSEQIIFPSVKDMYDRAVNRLSDTLGLPVIAAFSERTFNEAPQTFYTSSLDSVCKKMMARSNNLIAEQLLLMVSNQLWGKMNEKIIIEKITADITSQFPQKPVWVDGSGLSRYNLFTPEDIIYLLKKLEVEFGADRIRRIFPTGNEGTLKGYYDDMAEIIYAKTGTLSGQISLSGYLKSRKKRSLIFSILINNHNGKAADVRKTVAKYIDFIKKKY